MTISQQETNGRSLILDNIPLSWTSLINSGGVERVRNEYTGSFPTEYQCSQCREVKPVDQFGKPDRGKRLPRQPCKPCVTIRNQESYRKSKRSGYDRVYEQLLRDKYGLTLAEYEAMERAQGKRCAICQRPETKKRRNGERYRLSVDHDHATNAVRALVCHRCNLVVWALEDNHTTLAAVTAYITEHRIKFAEP